MVSPDTSAEFASDLYSHLDSSGGDYTDIIDQLKNCDQESVGEIIESIEQADEQLTEAFEILDEDILNAIEYNRSQGEFTGDVETEVREVSDLLEGAENYVESALKDSQDLEETAVSDDFKFGVHTDPESALQYLYGDIKHMKEMAFEMERKY